MRRSGLKLQWTDGRRADATDGERDEGQTHESKRKARVGGGVCATFHAGFTTHKYSSAHVGSIENFLAVADSLKMGIENHSYSESFTLPNSRKINFFLKIHNAWKRPWQFQSE